MTSRPRKAPTVDSSAPWFGRHLRKRTAPELRGYEFSDKRKLKKFMYNENGEDVRLINPGVNWKVLSELRATYKENYEKAVGEIFDKVMSTMLATSRLLSTQQSEQNLVDLTNTTYRTRSHARKDSVPLGRSGDENTEPGLATAPSATKKEVPISTNRERRNSQGEEQCEALTSECKDSLPSTTVRRSARARTRRQKVHLDNGSSSDACAEVVPSTKRVTRLRARTAKAPTADGSISDWDSNIVDTASHRTTRSRTRRAVPEPEVIVPVHQHSSRVSDGVEIITEVKNGHTKTSSEADCTKTSSGTDHTKTSSVADCAKLNNEPQEDNRGVSDPTLAEQSSSQIPDQSRIQKVPVLNSSEMKPPERPVDSPPKTDLQEPQPHPEPIEAAGVKDRKSPCHILSAVSSSPDVTTDCSYAADTEDECVPSKRPRASKRLPLKLKKKRKKKRKASTAAKRRKVEGESEAKTFDATDSDDRERTGTTEEQPITSDHTEASRVEPEAPTNLVESLYESCVEDVDTPNCTSACPSGADKLSTQLKGSTNASQAPTPTKSTGSNNVPTPQTYTKLTPALSPTNSAHESAEPKPTLPSTPQTYDKSRPALPSTPQTYDKSRPALSPTIPAPQMGTHTKLRPALSPTIPAPQMGTHTKLRPALSPTSVSYLTGTPKTIRMLQEEHSTQTRSNVVSFSELMASKGRTPQSPRVVTTAAKTCKSPAKPSSIPVPINRAQLCGTKRLRSVSLEKLPNSLATKRPSKTSTPESTNVDSATTSSDGTEGEDSPPDSVGGGMDSQEFVSTPDTPFMPTIPTPATPSHLRETESSESFTSSSASSSEKTDQSDTTPYSVVGGDSQNVHTSPSRLRQPGFPSSGKSASTDTGNSKEKGTVTKTMQSLWNIMEKGDVSKLTYNAPSELPSFLPHTPLRKQDTLEERHMKRLEKIQQKKEEVEKRKRELEAKKQRDLQDKIRKREERAKRVAENQAMKQREEEERKRRAQGQWVHEEQMKKIAQKKAKEMEERNRKHKERMQAAEVRRRQEEELKKRHLQQIQEDRRMAEELARKRLEQEEEEKRQRRQEKLKVERERQLQREREAEMRRLQEEEDRQQAEKQHRHQEELRKMQDQAMKEEKKRKFEQLLTGSGNKFMKPPAPPPSQQASNTSKFIQQWKQLKTQAGDFFSTVTKNKPPQGQQVSPPQEEGSVLNSTFTKDTCTSSELTTTDAATGASVTQSSATPVHNKKHTPISSYQMTPIQDDPLYDNYDIANLNSDDSTDDDECPRKQIPAWAQPQFLNTWIQGQEEEVRRNMIDITRLFPPEELLKEPDLAKIFRKKRKRFFDRTSSAQWTSPMLKKSRADCL